MPTLPPGPGRNRPASAAKAASAAHHASPKPVIHKGHPVSLTPPTPPRISSFVTVSWAWTDQAAGNISWTFVNSDPHNSHAVVLYRGATGVGDYIFGGAFWPIYLGPDNPASHMLDATQPLPTLSGTGGQPMGLIDYGPSASPRYLVHFIFNLAPGQTWSTPEGGFAGITPDAGACYELDSYVAGNYCVGYDPARVTDWDNQVHDTDRGYSPNPTTFYTYAFTPNRLARRTLSDSTTPLPPAPARLKNFYFVTNQNTFGRDEVADNPDYPLAFYLFLEGIPPMRSDLRCLRSPAPSTPPISPA